MKTNGMGKTIDQLYTIRARRLKLEQSIEDLKKDEAELKGELIRSLGQSGLSSARGKIAGVSISTVRTVGVEDWDAFYSYIKKNNAFELLQRRPAEMAVRERWDDGVVVPGTVPVPVTKVNVSKAPARKSAR